MKKKLLIIGPVVLLLLVAGVYMMVLKPKPVPPDEAELKKAPGPVYPLPEAFVVNLADVGGVRHFAKVGVALRFSEYSADHAPGGAGHGGDPADPAAGGIEEDSEIRDIVIATLQGSTSTELGTRKGREEVKKTIVHEVNADTDLHILDVYYTEFAVQ